MNASPCRLVRVAVLLAGLAAAAPAAAQADDPLSGLAHRAAEQWAKKLIGSIYYRGDRPDARKRLALEPLNPQKFGLSDRHRWQIYGWMLGGLARADARYEIVDRARLMDSYRAMEETGADNLTKKYLDILKSTATRINVFCEGYSTHDLVSLGCFAKDIDTGKVLSEDSNVSFKKDWLPLVGLEQALRDAARRIASRLAQPAVVGDIRVKDRVRNNDPALREYVDGLLRSNLRHPGSRSVALGAERTMYRLEVTLTPFDPRKFSLNVMVFSGDKRVPDDSVRDDVAVASLPVIQDTVSPGGGVDPPPTPTPITLPDGYTLADWVLMADERLSRGEHTRLLTEANRYIRSHGDEAVRAGVAEVRERAVSGLVQAIRVATREGAAEALQRIARIEASAGVRPALLRLKARAHRLLGDFSAEESAHVAWLKAAPQDHPQRREVLSSLARVREWLAQHERFAELLGRPFSRDTAEGGVGWTDLHYAAALDLPGVVAALLDAGMAVDTRLSEDSSPFGDDLKRALARIRRAGFFEGWNADGETPLMIAATVDARRALEYLVERGADTGARNGQGETLLHLAARKKARKAVDELVRRGADVNAKDDGGTTPLDFMEFMWQAGRKFQDCAECPWMVVVPAGEYWMGSPEGEAGRDEDEGPRHRVRIGEVFAVGKYEVTRGEYGAFVRATGRNMSGGCLVWDVGAGKWKKEEGRSWVNAGYDQGEGHPVVCVSWADAKAYVAWLSEKTGKAYRLLSEAEWEYVARGGTETSRYWGDSEVGQCDHANGGDVTLKEEYGDWKWVTAPCRDGSIHTSEVGRYGENGYGLADMLGNVWEWVEDCWHESYGGAPEDGSAWVTGGNCDRRVLRGGSWVNEPWNLRSAIRSRDSAGFRGYGDGFRIARTLTP